MRRVLSRIGVVCALMAVAMGGAADPALGTADEARWKFFPGSPPLDGSSTDTRVVGCFPEGTNSPSAGCQLDVRTPTANRNATGTPVPWDRDGAAGAGNTTFTTSGNNADTALSMESPLVP